jgi:hypothetical protein
VPLIGGRRGVAAVALFTVAAYLTNLWFPDEYYLYQGDLEAGPASLLLARNLALLGMVVVLLVPARAVRSGRTMFLSTLGREPV